MVPIFSQKDSSLSVLFPDTGDRGDFGLGVAMFTIANRIFSHFSQSQNKSADEGIIKYSTKLVVTTRWCLPTAEVEMLVMTSVHRLRQHAKRIFTVYSMYCSKVLFWKDLAIIYHSHFLRYFTFLKRKLFTTLDDSVNYYFADNIIIYTFVTMPEIEICKLLVYIFRNSPLLHNLVICVVFVYNIKRNRLNVTIIKLHPRCFDSIKCIPVWNIFCTSMDWFIGVKILRDGAYTTIVLWDLLYSSVKFYLCNARYSVRQWIRM